jgi:hypothetical protein
MRRFQRLSKSLPNNSFVKQKVVFFAQSHLHHTGIFSQLFWSDQIEIPERKAMDSDGNLCFINFENKIERRI